MAAYVRLSINPSTVVNVINKKLNTEQRLEFAKTCFGAYLGMHQIKFSSAIVHEMSMKLFKGDSDAVSSEGGSRAPFSKAEFALITGLCFGDFPTEEDVNAITSKHILDKYLKGNPNISVKEMSTCFKEAEFENDEDAVKMTLLYFLYNVVLHGDKNLKVDRTYLKMIEDVKVFNLYPWGEVSYSMTVDALRKASKMSGNDCYLKGFPLAFQVWCFEAIPSLGSYASKLNTAYPRILSWNFRSIVNFASIFATTNCDVQLLKPTPEEEKKSYFSGFMECMVHGSPLTNASQDDAIKQNDNEIRSLQGKLQQVKEDHDRLQGKLQQAKEDHDRLEAENQVYKEHIEKACAEFKTLARKTKALEASHDDAVRKLQQVEDQVYQEHVEKSCAELETLAIKKSIMEMADLLASERKENEELKRIVGELQDCLANKELQVIDGEKLRRKLHNTILELKGNIRVFCRVRPLLPDDNAGTETTVISYPTSTEALGQGIDLLQSGKKCSFLFDKVFNHEASQQDVFVEISELVQSALDGYKVCIFAYGQTGSGKTYTMMGRPGAPEDKGLIPRSLEQIFQISQSLQSQGWKYKMQASMLEIYNETIRDLLSTNRSSTADMMRTESSVGGKQYNIKHDADGNTHVSDLTIADVCSIKQISSLLHQAVQSRSVGKTQMNEQSSRSHFVFTFRISGVNEDTKQEVQGVLNLIDLAGSERLSKSCSVGDRLKETQAINKSLSSLSDVISALATKEEYVPFRNSMLTYLLKPCLEGDSKTLMFVNISPDPTSANESLCSLKFAARVNSCDIGIPGQTTTHLKKRKIKNLMSPIKGKRLAR